MATKNLGQVSAIHIGVSAPSNKNLIWRDISQNPNLWKIWNTLDNLWEVVPSQAVVNNFTALGDTPATYTGQGGKIVKVKLNQSGLEFVNETTFADEISLVDAKNTPLDADLFGLVDNGLKKVSWLNIKATLKTYFDTLYVSVNDVTGTLINNWNTAFGWGDHAAQGYLTEETDPVFTAHPASNVISTGDGTQYLSNDGTYKETVVTSDDTLSGSGTAGAPLGVEGGEVINTATLDTSITDTALFSFLDTTFKKITWANIKAVLNNVYQAVLVSGTNIKTINNESILGEGNLNIEGGGGLSTLTENKMLIGGAGNTPTEKSFTEVNQALGTDAALTHIDEADEVKHAGTQLSLTEYKMLIGDQFDKSEEVDTINIYDVPTDLKAYLSDDSKWLSGSDYLSQITVTGLTENGKIGMRYKDDYHFHECVDIDIWTRYPVANAYFNPFEIPLTEKTKLETSGNWTGSIYTGTAIADCPVGSEHYDASYFYKFVDNNVPIRLLRS